MNGTCRVTYLYPTNTGLTVIGGVESILENGKYAEIDQVYPKWIGQVGATDRSCLIKSISINRDSLIDPVENQSLDNAMLFFAMPELMDEVRKQDSLFPLMYSRRLSNEVDSSMANLIRRKFLGHQISLCDSDQFDVFACKLEKKVISLCTDNGGGTDILQYRVGSNHKLELSLTKQTVVDNARNKQFELFENGGSRYKVQFGNNDHSISAGVVVEKDGVTLFKQQCQSEMFESYLLPRK
jgi:hypothetical protein